MLERWKKEDKMILARFTDGDVDDQELPEFQTNVTIMILPGPVMVWALVCHSETRWSEFYEARMMGSYM